MLPLSYASLRAREIRFGTKRKYGKFFIDRALGPSLPIYERRGARYNARRREQIYVRGALFIPGA